MGLRSHLVVHPSHLLNDVHTRPAFESDKNNDKGDSTGMQKFAPHQYALKKNSTANPSRLAYGAFRFEKDVRPLYA